MTATLRILLLTHAFNSLTQRLFVELRADGHWVSVELDIADRVTEEAVALARPDVVLAPFLKRRVPESVWRHVPTLVLHPGPPGDRGPAALDHAVLEGLRDWGVTVLQAEAEYDAGRVWAWQALVLRGGATKAGLYRHEVSDAAVRAVRAALARCVPGEHAPAGPDPAPPAAPPRGWREAPAPALRRIDWAQHGVAEVLRRARAADSHPGVEAPLFGEPCRLFDLHAASAAVAGRSAGAPPGTVLARRGPGLLVQAADGAVWVGHLRRAGGPAAPLKRAATLAFADQAAALPEWPAPPLHDAAEWDELHYRECGPAQARVGWLAFDFHNGALSERQAARLVQAIAFARGRDTRVLVLAGGHDFFGNGIHLHEIEAAQHRAGDSAADASMRAIEAIDEVALAILSLDDRLTVAALRGNAGAGGCFLALAADRVWARRGVVLNPHYKNMGNLYGSEYWTYLLPRRIGAEAAQALMQGRLPMGAAEAARRGLIDEAVGDDTPGGEAVGDDADAFAARAEVMALALAASPDWAAHLQAKRERRAADEARRPLAAYRADELERMRRNFYGFDPSYHVARHHFVHRKPHAWTPRHLALHR